MNNSYSRIFVDELVLVGHRKRYGIPFTTGLNIIYGDSATGKSSVLEAINYLLGSSNFVFDDEIEETVLYVMMAVRLNNVEFVIKRDIFDKRADVEVYAANLEGMGKVFPKKFSPTYDREGPDGYFSDFLLTALNMPVVEVRQAPTKDDSVMVRLSFRDVFKFCYLKQDDVGSKSLLGDGGFHGVKSKETFKYIFNLLDTALSDLQRELSAATKERNQLEGTYKAVSDFLRVVEVKDEFRLEEARIEINTRRKIAKAELDKINSQIVSGNETYTALKGILTTLSAKIAEAERDISDADQAIEKFLRLRNDYQADIKKLKSIKTSQALIGQPHTTFSCPLCSSAVDLEEVKSIHHIDATDHVAQEVNAINRRTKDINSLLVRERNKRDISQAELKAFVSDRNDARRMLDEEMSSSITPYLAERDAWSYEVAKAEEAYLSIERNVKIRTQQKSIFQELENSLERIEALNIKISELRKAAPSISDLFQDLSDALFAFLHLIQISDIRDVSIDSSSYLPILRNRHYRDTTSGGLRTILSIGHFLGILKMSVDRISNHPGFLMIDTVGKYIGKTNARYADTNLKDDQKEGVSDPKKYANLYKAMLELSAYAEAKERDVQIIVVDNDLPEAIQSTAPAAIAAYFNSEGIDGAVRGLIDDAHLY